SGVTRWILDWEVGHPARASEHPPGADIVACRCPRSSGDRAPPSGGGSAGSNPAGGASVGGPLTWYDARQRPSVVSPCRRARPAWQGGRVETTQSFVGGEPLASRETYDNLDPATGRVLSRVARGGPEEVDLAVTTAARAQREWARTTPEQRATLLGRWADLVDRDAEALALTECEDTGKPLSQARTDTAVCARYLRFYAHAIETYYGRTIPRGPGSFAYTVREPFGVVGSIVAWNYPLQLASRTLAAAVATGNAAVLKPADETPRTA